MKTVNWSFHTGHEYNLDNPSSAKRFITEDYNGYQPLFKDLMKNRKGVTYAKCPAVTDFFKNTFVFCSPMDLNIEIKVDKNDASVWCNNVDQEFFDQMIDIRFFDKKEKGISPFPLLGIDFLNTFTCKHSIILQTLPAFLHYNDFTKKTKVIPGEYDISKWVRPLELVFEIENTIEKISIKKGDALAYFKFLDENIVKLKKNPVPWIEIIACNEIRNKNKYRPLKERYDSYTIWKNNGNTN
jgi:hypothetical protein